VNQHDPADAAADRLISLADALKLGAVLGDDGSQGERHADDRIQGAPALCREHLPWLQVARWKGGAR
jgi:hypothetical protein